MKEPDFEWTHFDNELYEKYLIAIGKMKEYKILYKYYLGSNTASEECQTIKKVVAYSEEDARNKFPLWKGLIVKIWEA